MGSLHNNVKDVALIFEGGGMRNSYSSAVVNALLENNIFFDAVYGLSSGAINAINYLSRDSNRSRITFTESMDILSFRKFVSFALDGIQQEYSLKNHRALSSEPLPFDFETFQKNPARLCLEGLNRDTGKTVYWRRTDFPTKEDLMLRVKASISYPLIMEPTKLTEKGAGVFYDGGLGEGGGIMLPRAERDGFTKFFVICTQPKGFRRKLTANKIYDLFFWRRPKMRHAFDTWAQRYNEQLDHLHELEKSGQAYVFYAQDQKVHNRELDTKKLKENYSCAYRQTQRELNDWLVFLNL